MKPPIYLAALLALTFATAASAGAQEEVRGTITYRERIALPPDAIVTIRLEDVSLMDAPSKLISEWRFLAGGKNVPISYRLPFSKGAIDKRFRYNVSARITLGDQLLFTSTEAHSVITNGVYRSNITLQKVTEVAAPIKGTTWRLSELNGRPAIKGLSRVPTFKLDTRNDGLVGHGGINQFTGTYQLSGDRLTIHPGPMTLMAGPEPMMKQEKAYVDMLGSVTRYRIVDRQLELLRNNRVVARFVR